MIGEKAEVAALRSIGAPSDVQSVLFFEELEQNQVSHTSVSARVGKHVARRGDKEDIGPFFIEIGHAVDTGDLLDVFHEEFQHILEGMGLDAQMVAGLVAV